MSTQLVQAIWGGILFGSVYGLMALGLTLVWGAVRLLNLAHGAIFVVGSYVAYFVVSRLNLPILVALPVGVLAAAAAAYLMHMAFIRPVIGKPGFDNSTLIATVGISIALSAAAILIFNPEYKVIPPIISGNFTLSDVQITKQGLLVIGTSLALFALVYLFLTYTRQGMAIRAVSQQQEAASLMAIPVVRTYGIVIAVSGALAGLAGVLLSPLFFLNPSSGFTPMIQALIVTIFGGLGSVRGALVAGYVLGIFESFVQVYFGSYLLALLILFFMQAVIAQAWKLIMGYGGIYSFAQIALYAIGGWTSGVLVHSLGWSPFLAILFAPLMATVAALLIGLPTLRLRGVYVVLLTLAFHGLSARFTVSGPRFISGGGYGLVSVQTFQFGDAVGDQRTIYLYYLAMVIFAIASFVIWRVI